jgi:hypothetical protein
MFELVELVRVRGLAGVLADGPPEFDHLVIGGV